MSEKVMTPRFRASFAQVFEAKENMNGVKQYSVTMLFPKDTDISALKKIVKDAAREKWGDKIPKGIRLPFRDGDEKSYDGYEGMIFVRASSRQRPGLVDDQRQPIIDQEEFYSGCYARATITAFAYDKAGNKGVAFGLQNIQKLDDGEPFSGKSKAEDDFGAIDKGNAADVNNSSLFGGDADAL